MEIKDLLNNFSYKGASCLFYTVDRNKDVWVLLGKRKLPHLFSSAYHWSIPEGSIAESESALDAAMRVAYEETGILDDRTKADIFWSVRVGGVSETLYTLRLSTKVAPKRSQSYSDLFWFRLGDAIDDIDPLAQSQLKHFSSYLKVRKKAV